KRLVGNAGSRERCFERRGIEMRIFTRAGVAAHVRDEFDTLRLQQIEKLVDRTGRVPDGPDCEWRERHGSGARHGGYDALCCRIGAATVEESPIKSCAFRWVSDRPPLRRGVQN